MVAWAIGSAVVLFLVVLWSILSVGAEADKWN